MKVVLGEKRLHQIYRSWYPDRFAHHLIQKSLLKREPSRVKFVKTNLKIIGIIIAMIKSSWTGGETESTAWGQQNSSIIRCKGPHHIYPPFPVFNALMIPIVWRPSRLEGSLPSILLAFFFCCKRQYYLCFRTRTVYLLWWICCDGCYSLARSIPANNEIIQIFFAFPLSHVSAPGVPDPKVFAYPWPRADRRTSDCHPAYAPSTPTSGNAVAATTTTSKTETILCCFVSTNTCHLSSLKLLVAHLRLSCKVPHSGQTNVHSTSKNLRCLQRFNFQVTDNGRLQSGPRMHIIASTVGLRFQPIHH